MILCYMLNADTNYYDLHHIKQNLNLLSKQNVNVFVGMAYFNNQVVSPLMLGRRMLEPNTIQ